MRHGDISSLFRIKNQQSKKACNVCDTDVSIVSLSLSVSSERYCCLTLFCVIPPEVFFFSLMVHMELLVERLV